MKYLAFPLLIILALCGCNKKGEQSLRTGEVVRIPIEFIGFNLTGIDNILVYRIDKANSLMIDTFLLNEILWAGSIVSTNEIITDNKPSKVVGNFGLYDSYFHESDLILDWPSGRDTLSDFVILKSREDVMGCHENDPNVKIDSFSFVHKGKVISNNQTIKIEN